MSEECVETRLRAEIARLRALLLRLVEARRGGDELFAGAAEAVAAEARELLEGKAGG